MRFGPLYSPANALGILLSTGNVGYHLSTKAKDTNTYLSRDGGKNWFEVTPLKPPIYIYLGEKRLSHLRNW